VRLWRSRRRDRISFTGGFPDPDSLPAKAIADATARAMEKNGKLALQYGSSVGYAGLIDQLRIKLARDNGVAIERENVLITSGASQAIDLVCSVLLNPAIPSSLKSQPGWVRCGCSGRIRRIALVSLSTMRGCGSMCWKIASRSQVQGHPAEVYLCHPDVSEPDRHYHAAPSAPALP